MKTRPLIVLLTDFGLKDGSVSAMKGVIRTICPEADIMDMSHDIPAFDVIVGGLILNMHYAYFPKGTIFVCVVDPGVGTERAPIALKAKGYTFIGPDNGIFGQAIPFPEYKNIEKMVVLENEKYFLTSVSDTFHGRDVFAPVAAHIARGVPLKRLGREVRPKCFLTPLSLPIHTEHQGELSSIFGKIVYIDDFGNLVSSIDKATFQDVIGEQPFHIWIDGTKWTCGIKRTFADGAEDEVVALFGGDFGDLLTFAVKEKSAAERTGATVGSEVRISNFVPPQRKALSKHKKRPK